MLAVVYHAPGDVRVEERPVPRIGPGELLLGIESASICATDLRIVQGGHRKYTPGVMRVPGHELVGTIVEMGAGVKDLVVGLRVFVAPNIGCGKCPPCGSGRNNLCADYEAFGITMDGAFAEYMRVTAAAVEQGNVIPIPGHLDGAAAALAEPFACVLHGQETVGVGANDAVLVEGAGPIGLMHVMLARLRGARRVMVSDLSPDRLRKAGELGAHRTVNVAEEDLSAVVAAETTGHGVDVVIVATAARAAQEQALALAAQGGRINFFAGLPRQQSEILIDANLMHYRELVLTGTTGCSTGDCRAAANLIISGKVDLAPLISLRYPLKDAVQALAAARDGSNLKVILEPHMKGTT